MKNLLPLLFLGPSAFASQSALVCKYLLSNAPSVREWAQIQTEKTNRALSYDPVTRTIKLTPQIQAQLDSVAAHNPALQEWADLIEVDRVAHAETEAVAIFKQLKSANKDPDAFKHLLTDWADEVIRKFHRFKNLRDDEKIKIEGIRKDIEAEIGNQSRHPGLLDPRPSMKIKALKDVLKGVNCITNMCDEAVTNYSQVLQSRLRELTELDQSLTELEMVLDKLIKIMQAETPKDNATKRYIILLQERYPLVVEAILKLVELSGGIHHNILDMNEKELITPMKERQKKLLQELERLESERLARIQAYLKIRAARRLP